SQAQFQAKLKGGGGFELSIGMTQDQVRALWGPPARWRSSNDYLQWTYINKGRDEAGRLCNVVVVFSNGQVVTWNND
ncbi:MAG TPA: outer membrane protein assembly factor BamE, partial [Bryobacterales bacterium]|nr:outer membrane protein assembly factor BamE [Bryobacterales bacterium]